VRAFCKATGIQLLLKEYSLDNRSRQPFSEDDILNIYPCVKHIHPKASDAYHVFTTGQAKIQQGLLREGYELISEALNLLNNIYGAMHPEIAACARLLARLNYIMGDYPEALVYQQRAELMSERVLGIDHPNTITEYFTLPCTALPTSIPHSTQADVPLLLPCFALSRGESPGSRLFDDSCFDCERTKETSECHKHLTQQAVKFQKTMNQLSKGEKIIYLPPLQPAYLIQSSQWICLQMRVGA